ncbi:hypothetical protein Gorai_018391 [Gossypium raimondii]|uniref:Uncharacterized protein n=1 Tax=Gossypium raimondii TaxID=29730 RepID=A0A7J8PK41_GOSRA|nr:hypothetical protein [Gossypium raimondii]
MHFLSLVFIPITKTLAHAMLEFY